MSPSTNLRYTANIEIGLSERLTALVLPVSGPAVAITPAFERGRTEPEAVVDELETWEESEDPLALVTAIVGRGKRIGVEGATAFSTAQALRARAGGTVEDATPLFETLRSVKSRAEQALIAAAAVRTERAIAATFRRLREGMTEREGSRILSEEFARLGTPSGGLVQFGPSAALPHGGPGDRRLARGDVVLIDTGCSVHGYNSDVTRMACLGAPSARVRKVYEIVAWAQRAGIDALKEGTPAQDVDRAARKVIEEACFGSRFTHRVGHGLGMDGHEVPYLVGGNGRKLVAGNVETIEPGIYIPGELGVRIEDDFAVTAGAARPLSGPAGEITVLG